MAINAQTVEQYYQSNLQEALKRVSDILNKEKKQPNFNGIIGGKGKIYVVDPKDYDTPESYVKAWMKGHEREYTKDKNKNQEYTKYDRSSYKIQALLEEEFVKGFIECYLMRIYFNNK
ncbi:topoisomerase [Bacillus thuringiensis]|uniref:topoisomerase n=1 Tax=Bacillus thuringiensis TaxID=1428 RepID=UPI000EA0EE70|nr:topoisomerase [Bacillus thuringiensis]RKI20790.1 topoisomerase [Bacillus thuringiensis]